MSTKKKYILESRKRIEEKLACIHEQKDAISQFLQTQCQKAESVAGALLRESDKKRFMTSFPSALGTLEEIFTSLLMLRDGIDKDGSSENESDEDSSSEDDRPPDVTKASNDVTKASNDVTKASNDAITHQAEQSSTLQSADEDLKIKHGEKDCNSTPTSANPKITESFSCEDPRPCDKSKTVAKVTQVAVNDDFCSVEACDVTNEAGCSVVNTSVSEHNGHSCGPISSLGEKQHCLTEQFAKNSINASKEKLNSTVSEEQLDTKVALPTYDDNRAELGLVKTSVEKSVEETTVKSELVTSIAAKSSCDDSKNALKLVQYCHDLSAEDSSILKSTVVDGENVPPLTSACENTNVENTSDDKTQISLHPCSTIRENTEVSRKLVSTAENHKEIRDDLNCFEQVNACTGSSDHDDANLLYARAETTQNINDTRCSLSVEVNRSKSNSPASCDMKLSPSWKPEGFPPPVELGKPQQNKNLNLSASAQNKSKITENISDTATKTTKPTYKRPKLKRPCKKPARVCSETSSVASTPTLLVPMTQPPVAISELGDYGNGPQISHLQLEHGCPITVAPQVVNTPNHFWVQPLSPKLEDLHNWLNSEHISLAEDSVWRQLHTPVSLGMIVCCQSAHDREWYRARVIALKKPRDKAVVLYIDYGNTEVKHVSDLRPLNPKFAVLPAQAFVCSLAEIGPPGGKQWSVPMCQHFRECLMRIPSYEADISREEICPLTFVKLHYTPLQSAHAVPNIKISVGCELVRSLQAECVPNQAIVRDYMEKQFEKSFNHPTDCDGMDLREIHIHQCPNIAYRDGTEPALQANEPMQTLQEQWSDVDSGCINFQRTDKLDNGRGVYVPAQSVLIHCDPDEQVTEAETARGDAANADTNDDASHTKPLHKQAGLDDISTQCETSEDKLEKSEPPVSVSATESSLVQTREDNVAGRRCSDSLSVHSNDVRDTLGDEVTSPSTPRSYEVSGKPSSRSEFLPHSLEGMDQEGKFNFMMSHIDSPSKFWVHIVSPKTQEQLDFLTQELNTCYSHMAKLTMERFFGDHVIKIGDPCCTLFAADNSFYRAKVVALKHELLSHGVHSEKGISEVKVHYVDFGNSEWVNPKKIHPLQTRFLELPPLAVPCLLADVYPRQKTSEEDSSPWSKSARQAFLDMTGYEKVFEGLRVNADVSQDNDGSAPSPTPYPLIVSTVEEVIINEEIVCQGHAVSKFISNNASFNTAGDSPPSKYTEDVTAGNSEWNPMVEDYESLRNSYAVDVDDPGVAAYCYKAEDEKYVCKFFQRGNCWRGETCSYRHISTKDTMTTDTAEVVAVDDTAHTVTLPQVGNWVILQVTAIISPAHFYAIMPYGPSQVSDLIMGTGQNLYDDEDSGISSLAESLDVLNEALNEHYSKMVYNDKDMTVLANGEIVAAKFSLNGDWYRARVIEADPDNTRVQVFYVDYGNSEWVHEKDVHLMLPKFMHLPFQSVECFMSLAPATDCWSENAKNMFQNLIRDYTTFAKIESSSICGQLSVALIGTGPKEEINIADLLISKGFACKDCTVFPEVCSRRRKSSRSISRSSSPLAKIFIPG